VEAPKELVNGKEYEPYYTRSKFKPLLSFGKDRTASIKTKTRNFTNITLQYDTFLDELIYTDTSRTINFRFPQISLNKDNIEGFNLYFEDDILTFKYFRYSDYPGGDLPEGFYEVVYEGESKYLIKHVSYVYERDGINEYNYKPANYISIGERYFRISKRKDLLTLFGEKSGAVREFLHSNRIRVKSAGKKQIVSVLKYYDSLVESER